VVTLEERLRILKMVEEGKLSAEDAAKLLDALNAGRPDGPAAGAANSDGDARWFRVRVTDTNTGKSKINVNLPLGLLNVGLKVGARFAPQVEDMDVGQVLRAIRNGNAGKIVDMVDEKDCEHVEIFVD
jgi:SHOCT-like domain